MKRLLFLLALCLGLCGCDSVFDGSYHSRTFHEEQGSHIQSTITATDISTLQAVMENLVSTGTVNAVINVTDFDSGTVKSAMKAVSDYIRTSYPLGAWAVDDLSYEIGSSGGMQAISVSITYLHICRIFGTLLAKTLVRYIYRILARLGNCGTPLRAAHVATLDALYNSCSTFVERILASQIVVSFVRKALATLRPPLYPSPIYSNPTHSSRPNSNATASQFL